MRPSHLAKWLMIMLLVINFIPSGIVSAQTVLQRLEEQIRQRVAPSQEGAPPSRRPAHITAIFPSAASTCAFAG